MGLEGSGCPHFPSSIPCLQAGSPANSARKTGSLPFSSEPQEVRTQHITKGCLGTDMPCKGLLVCVYSGSPHLKATVKVRVGSLTQAA